MNVPLITIAAFAFFTLLAILLMRRQKRSTVWQWLLLIVGPLLVVAVAGVAEVSRQNRVLAPFQPYLDEYLYLPGENAGNTVLQMTFAHPTDGPYIRGKIIPVQVRDNTLDILYFDLPTELRAESPDEVGTVSSGCTAHQSRWSSGAWGLPPVIRSSITATWRSLTERYRPSSRRVRSEKLQASRAVGKCYTRT